MDFTLYFDDFEKGITPETSHPVFVEHATENFFYSGGDDFSPFGNDTGNDTLRFLEEWYQERGAGEKATTFLNKMLNEWGFGAEYLLLTDPLQFEPISQKNEFLYTTVDQAIISIAFGQYKIAGRADKAMLRLAAGAFLRQRYLAEKAKVHPAKPWDLASEYLDRLNIMENSLAAMANKKAR